jgi:hypothetical protein
MSFGFWMKAPCLSELGMLHTVKQTASPNCLLIFSEVVSWPMWAGEGVLEAMETGNVMLRP